LPAAHIYEKVVSNIFYHCGGAIGFYSGDPQRLREDMLYLKPTVLACVPRILNRFSEVFRASVANEPEKKRKVIQKMIDEKLERLRKHGDPTHKLYDFLYFNKFKKLFGGKIRLGTTAAAPMNGQTLDMIKIFFCCNFIEGYGQTEVAGASTFTMPYDMRSGHIGGPVGCIAIKLVDIPEMSYTMNNNPPSGEICVKGLCVQPKYFKNPEATAEVFDEEGWMHTGDVAILSDNGYLSIIDRKKSFLKLSQGEFVSPERVENVYMQCGCVSFIFAYGDTFQNHLVSIVVPDKIFIGKEAQKLEIEKCWEDLCKDPQIKKLVLEKMNETGKKLGLNSIEEVRKIYLHPVMITPDSGLLTPTFKMKRKELKEYFASEIKQMYEDHHHHPHAL
jgi:long-chain acyl-CoA synthetase